MKGFILSFECQRGVKGYKIAVEKLFQRSILFVTGLSFQRRVIEDRFHSKGAALSIYPAADVTDTDDTDRFALEMEVELLSNLKQRSHYIFGNGIGV